MAQSLRVPLTEKDPVKVNSALNQVAQKIDNLFGGVGLHANLVLAPTSGVPLTITGPSNSLSRNIDITQSFGGTDTSANHQLNQLNISDSANLSGRVGNGLNLLYTYGGGSSAGSRQAAQISLISSGVIAGSNPFLVGVVANSEASANLGGGVGTEIGSLVALNANATADATATHLQELSGIEIVVTATAGSSMLGRLGLEITDASGSGGAQGSSFDEAIRIDAGATSPGWLTGLSLRNGGVASTGTLIKGAGSVAKGIDFSSATFSGNAFASNGFSVDGTGFIVGKAIQVSTTLSAASPTTYSGTPVSLTSSDSAAIFTAATTVTLTLPGAVGNPGRWIWVKTITAAVNSASSNVVPLASTTAGTALLSGAGKWALLQSDATNWIVMASN